MISQDFRPLAPSKYPELSLPTLLLTRYLFFLTRRPISRSNTHYVMRRIDGLKSLGELLDQVPEPRLRDSVRLLRGLTPQNLHETAERLQLTLHPLIQTELPRDFITADRSPPPNYLRDAHRILLLLGPAIGIGDEIITFPMPALIKQLNPMAEITVSSAYQGLWERVSGVDYAHHYADYLTITRAFRGELSLGRFDLVCLVDFESPELFQAICAERVIPRYVEISLGAQMLAVVDNRNRWFYRVHQPTAYFANFYYGFCNLLRGLGLRPCIEESFAHVVRRTCWPLEDELRIYVSPFTSKYDPSPLYWSRLLGSLMSPNPKRAVRFVLDPGPNLSTSRFALELARSAAARTPTGVHFEVARSGAGPGLPLAGVFEEMERCHLVLCADSFVAHAAPSLGCTTLVLATRGLEDWRVPCPTSFYFNVEDPLGDVIQGMQQILSHFDVVPPQDYCRPPLSEAEKGFTAVIQHLRHVLDNGHHGDLKALSASYSQLVELHRAVVARLPYWPPGAKKLLGDYRYELPLRLLEDDLPEEFQCDIARYVRNSYQQWQNTNLYKYLNFVLRQL